LRRRQLVLPLQTGRARIYDVADDVYVDKERELAAAMARD
jgi:hypothetical protein